MKHIIPIITYLLFGNSLANNPVDRASQPTHEYMFTHERLYRRVYIGSVLTHLSFFNMVFLFRSSQWLNCASCKIVSAMLGSPAGNLPR